MLEDPEIFHKKYITGEIGRESMPAFDVGTYFHTAILEPHNLEKECIVYPGAKRMGNAWETFKAEHAGKAIITTGDLTKAETLIKAIKESPVAMSYLEGGSAEVSAYLDVWVLNNNVYCVSDYMTTEEWPHILTIHGWMPDNISFDLLEEFGVKLKLKVRADSIRVGEGIISDLKSTTGNTKDKHEVESKIANYAYDLSASLYLDVFTAATGQEYKTFAWLFASKDLGNSKTWLASERNIQAGRVKYKRAVVLLAKYISCDWVFSDEAGICEPTFYNAILINEEF